jgi:ubiquinone/menaquinone biosynthesis C-methylase UbiE
MNTSPEYINQKKTAAAFSRQSVIFDERYSNNTIIQYKRKRVRDHVLQYLNPNSCILELNSGTGEDAIWFAGKGHTVHATDIAAGMQQQLKQKAAAKKLEEKITTELISFTDLNNLQQRKQYDYIFSNFAGLNCTGKLDAVLKSFDAVLKPGGMVTMVLLPKFCLWEFALLFKGRFKTALRRWFSSKGVKAHLEGEYFTCWYYNPHFIIKNLAPNFIVKKIEGLCTIVPPSYIENFAEKHPQVYSFLKSKEDRLKSKWPWKYIGDYYIISLKKKDLPG